MYKLLLVLASAQALKRPQRALAVRGGEVDPITIGKGIVAASGIYGAFDPAANAGLYGIKAEDKGNAMMRLMGWSQILFAAALNLDMDSVVRRRSGCLLPASSRRRRGDGVTRCTPSPRLRRRRRGDGVMSYAISPFYRIGVHGQMAYHSIAFLLVAQPSFEKFQCPKAPDAVWMAICAAVGYKTLDGSLNKWVPTAIWLANGAQFFLAPQSAIDLYEMKGTNRLCQAMTGLMGGQMLCVGTYLAALLMEKSQSEAFAYAMAVNGLAAAKFALQDADDLKAPKSGPLAWAALSAGLAYKALN